MKTLVDCLLLLVKVDGLVAACTDDHSGYSVWLSGPLCASLAAKIKDANEEIRVNSQQKKGRVKWERREEICLLSSSSGLKLVGV